MNITKELNIQELIEHPLNLEIFDQIPEDRKNALKLSIKQNGLINPLTVMAFNKTGAKKYYIVSGHNRLSALKECGVKKVPCNIISPNRQGQDLDILICDNLLQRNLSIMEKSKAIYYLSESLNLAKEQIQHKLGVSLRFVQASMQLIRIYEELDEMQQKIAIKQLNSVKGINRALQIIKKLAYGTHTPNKNYTTKSDIIDVLKEEILKKENEIQRLKRTIKRKDKEILNLKTSVAVAENNKKLLKPDPFKKVK